MLGRCGASVVLGSGPGASLWCLGADVVMVGAGGAEWQEWCWLY